MDSQKFTGSHPLRYNFAQAFGERGADQEAVVQDADIISAVQFNNTGEMIATGDKGGRIVLLRRVDSGAQYLKARERPGDNDNFENGKMGLMPEPPEFRFWTQFQSHQPEFDYLKSMEIEEKINQIRWVRQVNGAHRLISTNDKTIKLWRIQETEVKSVVDFSMNSLDGSASSAQIQSRQTGGFFSKAQTLQSNFSSVSLPKIEKRGSIITASPRRCFSNAHAYHVNSISVNSDEETFISADDLRVNLWNLNVGGIGFNILDIKPSNMEDLSEVITAAEFHPSHCHLFMHSSSRGVVKLVDLRQSALCEGWAKEFEEPEDLNSKQSFFSEIIASISDLKFSPDGRYILTRDYMNLRLWDLNMEREPVLVVPVHEHLRARLCDLYENDCIFDKFQCAFSFDGGSLLTGSYNGLFQSYSARDGTGAAVEASVDFISGASGRLHYSAQALAASLIAGASALDLVDPTRRIMHLHSSPNCHVAAVAAGPALYIYHA